MLAHVNRGIEWFTHTVTHLIYSKYGCEWCSRSYQKMMDIEKQRAEARAPRDLYLAYLAKDPTVVVKPATGLRSPQVR